MGSYFLKVVLAIMLLVLLFLHSEAMRSGDNVKCNEKEKQSLLNFKHGLQDPYGILSSWSDKNSDCCKWKGIQCSNDTGLVQILDLRADRLKSRHYYYSFNFTSLKELQNMEYLDLSYNSFFRNQIPKDIGSFKNLRYLNLSHSSFEGSIPSEIGKLTHLRYLDLSGNYDIDGEIPYHLGNLSQLEYLDLNGNSLVGAIPSELGNLSQLEYLDLNWNSLVGAIPSELANLSHLQYLSLRGTSLSGAIPFQMGRLPKLHTLRVTGNFDDAEWLQMIGKRIPYLRELRLVDCSLSDNDIPSLFNSHSNLSTSLTILDLSDNMLTSSPFQLLTNYSLNLQELYLSGNNMVLSLSPPHYPHFPSLVILDLSYNNLISSIFHGNFNFSSKLQGLYLESCSLTDKSFLTPLDSIVSSLSSLIFLDLTSNLLKSSVIFQWIFNFTTNLHSLFLDRNLLEGPIPDEFGKFMNSLEYLSLSSNKLLGEIPTFFGNMCTLHELYLDENKLSGQLSNFIQNSSECNRYLVQRLDLSHNFITGFLPDFSVFPTLRDLDLSNNQFMREIPKSIGLLNELEYLHLEGNHLESDITESHFGNLVNLRELDLTDNSLSFKLGTSWLPPFQLFVLGLASCKLGPSFPNWIQPQNVLNFIDISNAGIDDHVPDWFWPKLQSICVMNMSFNNLKGTIPNLPLTLTNVFDVVLNSNQFEGGIPAFLLQALTLDLSNNKISNLNALLCDKITTTNLFTLDLSNNQITGQLHDCWDDLRSLQFLDIRNNKLSGKIPYSMDALLNLEVLVLRNNSLIGDLPSTLKGCTGLVILDVSENMMSGPIPLWIGERLLQLKILSLRLNGFFGSLPLQLCYLTHIHLLDLSRNNLSEGIPTCLKNLSAMTEMSVVSSKRGRKISPKNSYLDIYEPNVLLMWKGQESVYWNSESLLKSIDLSSNNLTGEIPKEVAYLLGLVSLNLSRNNLSGEIPSEIGNLTWLDFLDLSRNHLSGRIPSSLTQIDGLGKLDLSNNNLSGRIPFGRHFETFDASSFEGNMNICGEQLNKSCPEDQPAFEPQTPAVHKEGDNSDFYEALYMSLGIGFFIGFWGFLGPILFWKPWRNSYLRFLNNMKDYIYVMVAVNMAKFNRWLKG